MARAMLLKPSRAKRERLPEVIVSLTSIASRLDFARYAIATLLAQDVLPGKIVLWLSLKAQGGVPQALLELQDECFEIRFREDVGPHTKLVYALQEFPDSVLVTADDDMLYEKTWLRRLWLEHLRFPQDIVGHECRVIGSDAQGVLLPYRQWGRPKPGTASRSLLPLGYAGVLYPPGSLHADVTNVQLFRQLAPKADDLWFKAMSLRSGVMTRRSSDPGEKPIPVPFSQGVTLNSSNVAQDGNRNQWMALVDYFGFKLSSDR